MEEDPRESAVTLHVCITCRREEEPLEPREGRSGHKMRLALAEALQREGRSVPGIKLVPVECLSGCKRGCTVACSAPSKWSYVICDLDPQQHVNDILRFAEQYSAHPDGVPTWRDRPEIIKRSVLARVPPLPLGSAAQEEAA